VFDSVQNSAVSALWKTMSSFLWLPSLRSIENPYLGFFARYPKNIAMTFFNLVSLNPSNISLCLDNAIPFRIALTNSDIVDRSTALVNVVNGVIEPSEKVANGASAAKTIRQKASAPPKSPILHNTRAKGAIIRDTATPKRVSLNSGSKNSMTIAITPKIIHNKSWISLLQRSIVAAIVSIMSAKIMRTL